MPISYRRRYLKIKRRSSKKPLVVIKHSRIKTEKSLGYYPTINADLVSFEKSVENLQPIVCCNRTQAFNFKSPIEYKINGRCLPFYEDEAVEYLLYRLKTNRYIKDINAIVVPKQIESNCWFNSMFVMFFISDFGRVFFHYFRQFMIQGKTVTGERVDRDLWETFSLLNYIIEACVSGSKSAASLNTNKIIIRIYDLIGRQNKNPQIYQYKSAGNPIDYYIALINYLQHNELVSYKLNVNYFANWKETLSAAITPLSKMPHIIILEYMPHIITLPKPGNVEKPLKFTIQNCEYTLDSCAIIDKNQEHFCSAIVCNGREFIFDGYSKRRLIPFEWKSRINKNDDWQFKDYPKDIPAATWNFTSGYSCFMYYRTR